MKLHVVDGTYELFRSYYGTPPMSGPAGQPVGAVRGLIQTMLSLVRQPDVTHVACAFDTVIESFRNELFDGYKRGEGVPEDILSQFPLAERAITSLGIVIWPMVEFEADDAMATAAHRWRQDPEVDQVVICSPDKDMAQMVIGQEVVCLDRRRGLTLDEDGVWTKFGVAPESIPDYLGLVGDAADGLPGIPRWGAKTSSLILARYSHIEDIPDDATEWEVAVRGATGAAASLTANREKALFYRQLATLRTDVPIQESLSQLEWRGVPRQEFENLCSELGITGVNVRPNEWTTPE